MTTHSKKQMKRMESRKSHSWWWDSHINPKNSKWLDENLEEMDKSVKRMLKLIEEDGDSFAKKAEMYYQKRPELISLVEEFYRMYRSLAERYDHVTGELRRNIPSDLQSQCSGISDLGSTSGQSSTLPSPRKLGHRKSSNRAAGFDFFLGSGGNCSDVGHGEGYESSALTDSEEESDDSSINNDSGFPGSLSDHNGQSRKIMELEIELRELKEKLWLQEDENAERGARNENTEDIHAKLHGYEHELKTVNEKLRLSKEEVSILKIELDRVRSLELANLQAAVEFSSTEEDMKTGGPVLDLKTSVLQGSVERLEQEISEPDSKIKSLEVELRNTKEKLEASEKHIASLESEATKSSVRIQQLQDQVDLAFEDIAAWKTKFNAEKRETTKLLERLENIKINLSAQDHEIVDLKAAVADAEQKIFPEKAQVEAEMSKLMVERTHLKEQIREWECRGHSFEEEIRKINSEKAEIEAVKGEIEQLKVDIKGRDDNIKDLNATFKALKIERDTLNAEVGWLKGEVNTRDDQIEQLAWHLNQLHMEHVKLIAGMEEAHKQVQELKLRGKELEEEVERQRTEILEGAEEKREAIRQLCVSLEHYRNDYDRLRQDYVGRKRVSVLAA